MTRHGSSGHSTRPDRCTGHLLLCVLGLLVCACPSFASSGVEPEKEVQLRAAFLLNFVKFTEWPEEAFSDREADFVIAVVGPDPFGRTLEQTFAKLKVQGRKVTIRRWVLPQPDDYSSTADFDKAVGELRKQIQSAHLVYLTISEPAQLDRALKGVDTSLVLTVGSESRSAKHGTVLALDRDEDRVVFYANLERLRALKLKVSSRLLSLAKLIKEPERQGATP